MAVDTGFADRDLVLNYLHDQLVGPVGGPAELLEDRPHLRYLTAVIYPQVEHDGSNAAPLEDQPAEADEPVDESPGQFDDDAEDDPITLAGQTRPSSVGVSFVTSTLSPVDVEVELGRYSAAGDDEWRREQVSLTGPKAVRLDRRNPTVQQLDGDISLQARWRPHGDGAIVTVVLVNLRKRDRTSAVQPSDCLFQVLLRCRPVQGVLCRYPGNRHLRSDEEADEMDLVYRDVPVFAVGHGAAAEWDREVDPPRHVQTSFFPVHVVQDVAFDIPGGNTEVLRLRRLAQVETNSDTIVRELDQFVDGYSAWVEQVRDSVVDGLEERLRTAADRLVGRMLRAAERMRHGIRLLAERPTVRKAFGLANLVMLMQMEHRKSELAGSSHPVLAAPLNVSVDYRD